MSLRGIFFVMLFPLSSLCVAQQWIDPTRPPTAALSADTSDGGGVNGYVGPLLQSVKLPRAGRPMAIIDSQPVAVGGKVGEARLVKLTEFSAVLVGPGGRQELFLTPGVEKQPIKGVSKKDAGTGHSGSGERK